MPSSRLRSAAFTLIELMIVVAIIGKYLTAIPKAYTPNYHNDVNEVAYGSAFEDVTDGGGWIYGNVPEATDTFGDVYVNCTHTDTKGSSWVSY